MKKVVFSLGLVVVMCGATQPTTKDVVVLQGYTAGVVVDSKYNVQGMYVYASSSSSNSPVFDQYPHSTVQIAQALSDLLSAGFRISNYSESTGTYTLVR